MRKSRFTEEQMVKSPAGGGQGALPEVAKRHGVSDVAERDPEIE